MEVQGPDDDAHKAARHARRVHQDALDQTGEITVLSDQVRRLRETNHFAQLIRDAVRNGNTTK